MLYYLAPDFVITCQCYVFNHKTMNIIIFLITISIIVAAVFLAGFFWAVRSGQYDDDYTPSVRILLEDDMIKNKEQNHS